MKIERHPGCLGYIGEYTPSYIAIILKHYKDPYYTTRIQWNVSEVLILWLT